MTHEEMIEVAARAICHVKGLNPDSIHQINVFDGKEPYDTEDNHGRRYIFGWRIQVKSAEAALSAAFTTMSDPVAKLVPKHGDPEAFGERELVLLTDIQKMPYGTRFYAAPQPAAVKVKTLERQALAEAIAERLRQIEAEGWSAEHDDSHAHGEMARAAAAYCLGQWELTGAVQDGKRFLPWRKLIWPWSKEWWKPKTRREDLIRAAALIIAEIERLDRSVLEGGTR